jgi:hypothetical protein
VSGRAPVRGASPHRRAALSPAVHEIENGTVRLPVEIPSTDAAVRAQYEDVQNDSLFPTYHHGAGSLLPTNQAGAYRRLGGRRCAVRRRRPFNPRTG